MHNERIEIPINVALYEETLEASLSESAELKASFGTMQKVSTSKYDELIGKPTINEVTVQGDKTGADYNLQNKMNAISVQDIEKMLYLD